MNEETPSSASTKVEGEDPPSPRRDAVDPPGENDRLQQLPRELRHLIASVVNELIRADGGLSEESVAGIAQDPLIINNLSNLTRPLLQAFLTDQTVISGLTDPSFFTQFEDASEDTRMELLDNRLMAYRLAGDRSSVESESSGVSEESNSGAMEYSIVSGQFSDPSDPLLEPLMNVGGAMSVSTSTFSDLEQQTDDGNVLVSTMRVKPSPTPSNCGKIVCGILALLATCMGSYVIYRGIHKYELSHSKGRQEDVLACASKLSGKKITEVDDPIRWRATTYFLTGGGRKIQTAYCDYENSLFSVMYGLLVVRESLNVSHATWHHDDDKISNPMQVCNSWKRVQCKGVGITGLVLNHADLVGTIPPEVSWLRNLEVLEVYSNKDVTGPIPTELGLMKNLHTLKIQETLVGGPIPSELGRLSELQEFDLYDTLLSGNMPKEVCALKPPHLTASCNGGRHSIQCTCCTHCVTPPEDSFNEVVGEDA